MEGSLPSDAILSFIDSNKPEVVLLSITIEDNLLAGQRLVKKIREHKKIPVLIGGYALQSKNIPKFDGQIVADCGLEEIPKILKSV